MGYGSAARQHPTDQLLVKRALRGDEGAFEELVRRYQKPIINFIARMLGQYDMALDLSQEVFLKTYSSLATYNENYKFGSWIFKIASNTVIDHLRKSGVTIYSLDQPLETAEDEVMIDVEAETLGQDTQLERAETGSLLGQLIEQLPPDYREVMVLRHVNDLSYEEIADITNLPMGTVKNRIFRAREMLRRKIERLEARGIRVG